VGAVTPPKSESTSGGDQVDPPERKEEQLAEMEEEVKDAIVYGNCTDATLARLIDMVIAGMASNKPVKATPDILSEPAFFHKYFICWVREGLDEMHKIREAGEETKQMLGNGVMPPTPFP